jgi:hypothetical protein
MHLCRDTSPVLLATCGASLSLIELHCRSVAAAWACLSACASVLVRAACCCHCRSPRSCALCSPARSLTHLLLLLPPLAVLRWKSSVLTCHYLEKAGTIVGVRAVALLAGLPEDFKKQCYIGWLQVPVPPSWVDKLLPGIFKLQQQLRTQAQASSKRDLDLLGYRNAPGCVLMASVQETRGKWAASDHRRHVHAPGSTKPQPMPGTLA